jgi:hypothetical protein
MSQNPSKHLIGEIPGSPAYNNKPYKKRNPYGEGKEPEAEYNKMDLFPLHDRERFIDKSLTC